MSLFPTKLRCEVCKDPIQGGTSQVDDEIIGSVCPICFIRLRLAKIVLREVGIRGCTHAPTPDSKAGQE